MGGLICVYDILDGLGHCFAKAVVHGHLKCSRVETKFRKPPRVFV